MSPQQPPPKATAEDKWPAAAEKDYERVRELGRGNFGAVWLCKNKKALATSKDINDKTAGYVAVKNVDISKPSFKAYAEREIAVLSEMNHPCVINLVKAYKATKKTPDCRLVVMSLANGPNLKSVVETGGAVGLPLARLVSRHLVSAVSYLHTRAVVHRDIKTDNCALCRIDVDPSGAGYDWMKDDLIWSDDSDAQKEVDSGRWRIVLVDFGMARALSAEDMGLKPKEEKKEEKKDDEKTDEEALMASARKLGGGLAPLEEEEPSPEKEKANGKPSRRLHRAESVSRLKIKRLSALGTYEFAAPEISQQYRKKTAADVAKTKSLTKCIADYGLIADAYSLGTTLREVLTGVPPSIEEQEVDAYIKKKSKGSGMASKLMGKKKRKRRFCKMDEIPSAAALLINKLSEKKASNRITVREGQIHPWIAGGVGEPKFKLPEGDVKTRSGTKMVYLECATDGTFDKEVM